MDKLSDKELEKVEKLLNFDLNTKDRVLDGN